MQLVVDGIIYENQKQGGVSRIYSEILPRMCDLDLQLSVTVLTSGAVQQAVPAKQNIRHEVFPKLEHILPGRWFYSQRRRIRAFSQAAKLRNKDFGIWHSTYFTRPFHWRGPVVVTVLDMIYERFPELFSRPVDRAFRKYKRACVEEADVIICISKSARRDLMECYGLSPERIQVIPLAASSIFQKLPTQDMGEISRPFILYVGGRQNYKNFWRLIGAYSTWNMSNEVDLVVVGRSWTSEERGLLAALKLDAQVHLRTGVSDAELCLLYNRAAAFVYPSLYEGFGIPLLEAMKCGCPIVTSRIPSSIEVAADGALYFDPDNCEELQSALSAAIEAGRESARVSAGLKLVREFSWAKCAEQTLAVYHQLAN